MPNRMPCFVSKHLYERMLHFGKLNFLFGLHFQKLTFQFQVKSSLFHLFNAATEISDENLAIKVNRWAIFRALYQTSMWFLIFQIEGSICQMICCPICFHVKGFFVINTETIMKVCTFCHF